MAVHLLIDPSSAVPIYSQVVQQVRSLVATNALRRGDRLPAVRELAASLRINRNTVAKAYQILESERVVTTRPGQGTFILDTESPWSLSERIRRLEASLDRALVDAYHMEIPFESLPGILQERIKAFIRRPVSHKTSNSARKTQE